MNKTELIAQIAERAGVTKLLARTMLTAFTETVAQALTENDRKVVILKFGTFLAKYRAKRAGRDLRTGEPIEIPGQYVVRFKPSKNLKEEVSG